MVPGSNANERICDLVPTSLHEQVDEMTATGDITSSADESFVVIRFADPHGIDFPNLMSMLHDSFMSRPNIIVCPGGTMGLAMQIIFTPMILQVMDRKRRRR